MPTVAPEDRVRESEKELHVGLEIPRHSARQIYLWARSQQWPEGTELEKPGDYHITLLYTPEGHEEHKDAWWLEHLEQTEVIIKGIKAFPAQEKGYAYVLTIDSDEVQQKAEEMQGRAEWAGLPITKFDGGYKPHITVGYGPSSRLTGVAPPHFQFDVGPSSVSPPRIRESASQHFSWQSELWDQPYYHVAPQHARDQIEQEGLHSEDWQQPPYVWMFDDLDRAKQLQESQSQRPHDIWEVQPFGTLERDPHPGTELTNGYSWVHDGPVPREHINRLGGKAPEPPNYRHGTEDEHCGSCKMFFEGHCWGYGNKKVEEDATCDSWAKETRTAAMDDYGNEIPWWEHANWGELLNSQQIAEHYGLVPSAISNYQTRYPDFPQSILPEGQQWGKLKLFPANQVHEWFKRRGQGRTAPMALSEPDPRWTGPVTEPSLEQPEAPSQEQPWFGYKRGDPDDIEENPPHGTRLAYNPEEAQGLNHLSLTSVAHNLHYKFAEGGLNAELATDYAKRLLKMIGYPPDDITVQAALQTWQQLYPDDQLGANPSQLSTPQVDSHDETAPATVPQESWGYGTTSKMAAEVKPWNLGQMGKGVLDAEGYPHVWAVDNYGSPHHHEQIASLRSQGIQFPQPKSSDDVRLSPILIAPSGHYTTSLGLNEHPKEEWAAMGGNESLFGHQNSGLRYVPNTDMWYTNLLRGRYGKVSGVSGKFAHSSGELCYSKSQAFNHTGALSTPHLYHWLDASQIHDWMDGSHTGPGETFLTETGADPHNEWNPDVPRFDNPVRLTIDPQHLDPNYFDPQYEGWLGNHLYRGPISQDAITDIKSFKRPDEWDEDFSTVPSQVNNPEDHWPEFGDQPPDRRRDIQFSNDFNWRSSGTLADMKNETKHPLYTTWQGMHQRCRDPNYQKFAYYGGRGIRVCERWSGKEGFANFVTDMDERPEGTTLDRIDNAKNYEPDNCRWATRHDQRVNQIRPHERIACTITGCNEPHQARGWCTKHYTRWRRTGNPGDVRERDWHCDRNEQGQWVASGAKTALSISPKGLIKDHLIRTFGPESIVPEDAAEAIRQRMQDYLEEEEAQGQEPIAA